MKLYPLRLVPDNISIDFMKMRKINYIISIGLSILSIIWVCIFGFNFGIDFAGGIRGWLIDFGDLFVGDW